MASNYTVPQDFLDRNPVVCSKNLHNPVEMLITSALVVERRSQPIIHYVLNNVKFKKVILLGKILEKSISKGKLQLKLDDGTGTIDLVVENKDLTTELAFLNQSLDDTQKKLEKLTRFSQEFEFRQELKPLYENIEQVLKRSVLNLTGDFKVGDNIRAVGILSYQFRARAVYTHIITKIPEDLVQAEKTKHFESFLRLFNPEMLGKLNTQQN